MKWPELEIQDWMQFMEVAARLTPRRTKPSYLFRGQSKKKWPLEPSLVRLLKNRVTPEQAIEIEQHALFEFRSKAHLHLKPFEIPLQHDLCSWWSIMQHYSAPTRMLDWAKSPYVALYFAIAGNPSCDGALWYYHMRRIKETFGEFGQLDPNKYGETLLNPHAPVSLFDVERHTPSHRMVAQQGGFTVSMQVMANHGDAIASVIQDNDNKEWFRKLIIPSVLKHDFLSRLRAMNVTADALFPGADGLGRSVAELIQIAVPSASAR